MHGGATMYARLALAAAFALGTWVTRVRRVRELSVLLVILVGVFNFTPALFSPINLSDAPLWSKVVKDGAVLVLFAVAAMVALTTPTPAAGPRVRHYRTAIAVMAGLMLADFALRGEFLLGFLASYRYYVVYPLVTVVVIRMGLARREITSILKAVIFLGAFEGVLALIGFLGFGSTTYYEGSLAVGGDSYSRAIGTLGNPNNLGLFLGLPAMLLLYRAPFTSMASRILLGAPVALGMALSFSKSAVLAFSLVIILQRSTGGTRSARYFRAAVIGTLGAGLAYFAIQSRTATQLTPETLFGDRVESIPKAYDEWTSSLTNLLVGHGYGFTAPGRFGGPGGFVTDSMPLTLALEGGIVAVAAFVLLVGLGWHLGAPRVRARRQSAIESGLWGYVLFFLCYTPIADNFRLFPGALLFWIVLGLLVCWRSEGVGTNAPVAGGIHPRQRSSNLSQTAVCKSVAPKFDLIRGPSKVTISDRSA